MYIVEATKKKEKTEERRKNERTLLFRRTLIVNVEDRRQSRNNDYGKEKQRRKRKCNRFPASERTRKISLNTSYRMVIVMVSSIACVGYFGDQLHCVYERRRERANIWKRKAIALYNCYSSSPHHNQY